MKKFKVRVNKGYSYRQGPEVFEEGAVVETDEQTFASQNWKATKMSPEKKKEVKEKDVPKSMVEDRMVKSVRKRMSLND